MRYAHWLVLSVVLMGCNPGDPHVVWEPGDSSDDGDTTPPVIEHDPVETTQIYGESVPLSATVTDEGSSVFVVQAYYRQETSSVWKDITLLDPDSDGVYVGQIPGIDVMTGGMYYYLFAVDTAENEGLLPQEGASDAFHFRISPD